MQIRSAWPSQQWWKDMQQHIFAEGEVDADMLRCDKDETDISRDRQTAQQNIGLGLHLHQQRSVNTEQRRYERGCRKPLSLSGWLFTTGGDSREGWRTSGMVSRVQGHTAHRHSLAAPLRCDGQARDTTWYTRFCFLRQCQRVLLSRITTGRVTLSTPPRFTVFGLLVSLCVRLLFEHLMRTRLWSTAPLLWGDVIRWLRSVVRSEFLVYPKYKSGGTVTNISVPPFLCPAHSARICENALARVWGHFAPQIAPNPSEKQIRTANRPKPEN